MKYLKIGIYLIVSVLFLAACKEDKGNIGLDVQPYDEFLNTDYFDTTTIIAYSAAQDSLITSNVSINMLGYLDDPIFGKTQAGIYTQFRLSAYSVDFGDSVTVDSLVLTLVYAGYYGDTLNSFKLNVYELDENMSKNEKYYATSSIRHKGSSLTENPNLYISPRPATKQDTAASAYYLSVRLDKNFAANKFISQSGGNVYANDANFLDYFKGLYLEASGLGNDGCIISLNMTHALSKLTVYYKNSQKDSLKYSFNLNDSTVHFGVFDHFNYASATSNLQDQLSGNHASTKEILYGQAGAGIKMSLRFPHLKEMFKDKKVIIHRAALVISYKEDAQTNYTPPSALSITTDSTIGWGGFMPDYILELQYNNNGYYGGKYNQTKKEYAFNITRYIQGLADGTWEDHPLTLLVSPNVTHFSRLMIYGTNPAADFNKRLQLKVNYTVVK